MRQIRNSLAHPCPAAASIWISGKHRQIASRVLLPRSQPSSSEGWAGRSPFLPFLTSKELLPTARYGTTQLPPGEHGSGGKYTDVVPRRLIHTSAEALHPMPVAVTTGCTSAR